MDVMWFHSAVLTIKLCFHNEDIKKYLELIPQHMKQRQYFTLKTIKPNKEFVLSGGSDLPIPFTPN